MNALRAWRLSKQLTQAQLADQLCVERPLISAWENGVQRVSRNRLKMLRRLGFDPSEWTGQPPDAPPLP